MKHVLLANEFIDDLAHQPLTLVDVGVRNGIPERWRALQRYLRVVGFECDELEHARLLASGGPDASCMYLKTALAEQRSEADFYVAQRPGGSSFLQPNMQLLARFPQAERFQTVRVVRLNTDRLDDQLQAHQIDVDFIKLDTQGTELSILQGAPRVLSSEAIGCEIEVEFAPLYEHQPLFADVDGMMRKHGFELFDLRPCYWKRAVGTHLGGPQGQLMWADALYFRGPDSLMELLRSQRLPTEALRRSKAIRALLVVLLYGYADYALELACVMVQEGFLRSGDLERIRRLLARRQGLSGWLPRFRGRGRLALAAKALHELLRMPDGGILDEDRLGNDTH